MLTWLWLMVGFVSIAGCVAEDPDDVVRCVPGAGATGSPRTITEAVSLMDSLPKPTSVACFVESLDRPLRVEATYSIVSAQPAAGKRSPRIFAFYEPLILSLALDGDGRNLVELSEATVSNHTTKGEIAFPIDGPVTVADAFERVALDPGPPSTSCGFCHREESPSNLYDQGFSSLALKPLVDTLVPIDRIREEHALCDAEAEPERCRYLDALVAPGPLVHQAFPEAYPTLGE